MASCVTEGPPAPPAPRPSPPQPADARPDHLVTTAPQVPEDTDRNGYYDQFTVTVYLFDSRYATPIDVPGTFEFRLSAPDGRELARWAFDESRTRAALRRFMVGPGYQFSLNLLDAGGDRLPLTEALLCPEFRPAGGEAVVPRGGVTVMVGPAR
jgi:hypothetical protein